MGCDPGQTYVNWIYDVFGECVYNSRQEAGFFIGLSSTLIWMYAQIPQIIINCKRKQADSLSFPFLCLLVTGDLCNLVGAFLTGGLVTQIITASWFIIVDVFCAAQYIWYVWIKKQYYRIIEYSDVNESDNSPSKIPLIAAAGATLAASAGPYTPPDLYGTLLGWLSAISYISSRMPQICHNFKRRKTEGLSPQFFISAVLGNTTYAISIFLKDYHWDYIWRQFPWLLGSAGILFFDFTVLWQFCYYGTEGRPKDLASIEWAE